MNCEVNCFDKYYWSITINKYSLFTLCFKTDAHQEQVREVPNKPSSFMRATFTNKSFYQIPNFEKVGGEIVSLVSKDELLITVDQKKIVESLKFIFYQEGKFDSPSWFSRGNIDKYSVTYLQDAEKYVIHLGHELMEREEKYGELIENLVNYISNSTANILANNSFILSIEQKNLLLSLIEDINNSHVANHKEVAYLHDIMKSLIKNELAFSYVRANDLLKLIKNNKGKLVGKGNFKKAYSQLMINKNLTEYFLVVETIEKSHSTFSSETDKVDKSIIKKSRTINKPEDMIRKELIKYLHVESYGYINRESKSGRMQIYEYHKKYLGTVGRLINKVQSYEEIIKIMQQVRCAYKEALWLGLLPDDVHLDNIFVEFITPVVKIRVGDYGEWEYFTNNKRDKNLILINYQKTLLLLHEAAISNGLKPTSKEYEQYQKLIAIIDLSDGKLSTY